MTYMDAVYMGIGATLGSLLTFLGLTLGAMAGRYAPSLSADEAQLYSRLADIERERAEQRLKEAG